MQSAAASATIATGSTLAGFPLTSASQQDSLFPSLQGVGPPDTQVAVGPTDVVEAVNDTLSVWSKTGSLRNDYNLNAFFNVPTGFAGWSDPRVLYDSQSGRWFLSSFAIDASNDSLTYVAVSETSDPSGAWYKFTVADNSATRIFSDQPVIGLCDDKVVMSWNDLDSSQVFTDAQTVVIQKSSLLTGTLNAYFVPKNPGEYRLVPAQSVSPTTTCWMTVNKAESKFPGGSSTSPALGVIAVTGTPAASNVTLTETDVPIMPTSYAPDPRQPSGSTNDNQPDDRLLSAVWQNNELWTSATVACTPSGDTTVRSCLRLIEVSTAGTPSKLQDFNLSTSGLDEYYPAVSLDSAGDLFVAYSASSPTLDPGAYAVISPSTSIGTFTAPVVIEAGQAAYSGVRWGDYSSAAPDPSSPGAVWVAAEYATADGGSPNWGTAAAEVTLAPAITSADHVIFDTRVAASFTVTATGSPPPSFSESGALPNGVALSAAGLLSGTPASGTTGSYRIQITASNGIAPDYTQAFTLVVQQLPPAPAALAIGAEGTDGQLWAQAPQLGPGWHALGGRIVAAPAVAAAPNPDGATPADPLFIGTGADQRLWTRSASAGWQPVGGARCIGGPAAVITGGTLTVACRGTDNALWYTTATVPSSGLPAFTSAWKSLGGVLSAGPALAPVGGVLTFFVRGATGQVYTRTVTAGYAATPWTCAGQPAAALQAVTGTTTFAYSAGGTVGEAVNGGAGWSPATSLGGSLTGGPAIAAASQETDFLAEGTDQAVWEHTPAGWTSLGGKVSGGVGAAALN